MQAGSFAREPVQRLFRAHLRHAEVPVHESLVTAGSRVTGVGSRTAGAAGAVASRADSRATGSGTATLPLVAVW